jgi:hypothetical protein
MYQSEDYVQQLATHIKINLKKGYTIEAMTVSLLNQGYSRISVEKAIELANQQLAASAPEMKEKPQIIYKLISDKNQPIKISTIPKNSFWRWLRNRFV